MMLQDPYCLDPTGFPMVWVEEIGAYIHWLPVTKVQFEYFLCAAGDGQPDAAWYDEILTLNGRVSPAQVRGHNYWQAFITGVLPGEAKQFARWCGRHYELLSSDEWLAAFRALEKRAPLELDDLLALDGLNERARILVQWLEHAPQAALNRLGYQRTRAEQALLRLGVLEWVNLSGEPGQWGVLGELNPGFRSLLFSPIAGEVRVPKDPEGQRSAYHGFRLKWRP